MRVLVVEDELSTLQDIQQGLSFDPQSRVFPYSDVDQVLKDLPQLDPDLAFIDVSLPTLDGFELAYRVMRLYPQASIIFITRFKHIAAEAFELHGMDYILKPINPMRLKSALLKEKMRLKKTVEVARGAVSIKLFGAMEVKLNARNVRFKRRKSKEILSYLLLNQNKADRKSLREALYEEETPAKAEVLLQSQIYQLRSDLIPVSDAIQVEMEGDEYRLVLKKVSIDYHNFMNLKIDQLNVTQLENAILLYGRGLLLNCDCHWAIKDHLIALERYVLLHRTLVEKLEAMKDFDKLKNAIFDLKPHLVDLERLDYYSTLVKKHYMPSVYERFIALQ